LFPYSGAAAKLDVAAGVQPGDDTCAVRHGIAGRRLPHRPQAENGLIGARRPAIRQFIANVNQRSMT